MSEYIEREAANEVCRECVRKYPNSFYNGIEAVSSELRKLPAADVREVPEGGIGEMSDGYHTFNGLYYQRMVLFAALVKAHKDRAWKSLRHEDGELCFGGGWFIVGIDTPQGSYTYHYEDKDWNRFDCVELPVAKHWDGHTEKDVTRLLSLPAVRPVALCRECKHKGWVQEPEHGKSVDYCRLIERCVDKQFFCAAGEKREES